MARKSPAAASAGRVRSLPQESEQAPEYRGKGKGGYTTGASKSTALIGSKGEARKGGRKGRR